MVETAVQAMAEWAYALEYDRIPRPVRQACLRAILDTLGVAFAGSTTEPARRARDHAASQYGPGPSTMIGGRNGTTPRGAAFGNGVAAHALDFDDTCYAGICHGSAVLLPALLAASEAEARRGPDLVRSFVIGSEIAYALGKSLGDGVYFRGWFTTSLLGTVGAAAAVAATLRLDSDGIAGAIANAMALAGGSRAVLGSTFKPMLAGEAAALGLDCAYLAGGGSRAPHSLFSHRHGFLALAGAGNASPAPFEALGRCWSLLDPGLAVKRYPVCSAAQAAIEAVAGILEDRPMAADEIVSVSCRAPRLVAISLPYRRPNTVTEAQFSLPFAVACAVAHGGVAVTHLDPAVFRDERLGAIMDLVRLEAIPDGDPLAGQLYPEGAEVTLTARDGRVHRCTVERATGMPDRPLPDDALNAKFMQNTALAGLGGSRLMARIRGLEALEDVRDLLAPEHQAAGC